MEGRVILLGGKFCLDARELQDRLANAFESIEIDLAVSAEREHLFFVGQFLRTCFGQINLCDFKERDCLVFEVVVALENFEHRGERSRPHDAGILAERVGDDDRAAQGAIRGQTNVVVILGADEREGLNLRKSKPCKCLFAGDFKALLVASAAERGLRLHASGFDLVVAVDAADLFGDVVHAAEIGAEGGNVDFAALDLAAEPFERVDHVLYRDVHAEEFVVALGSEGKNRLLFLGGINVDHAVHDLSRAEQFHELASALESGQAVFGVKSLFKAGRGFGAHAVLLGGHADRGAVEAGRFKDNRLGRVENLGVGSTHDACQSAGFLAVGDDEHAVVQNMVAVVEGSKGFTLLCAADVDLCAVEAGVVKGVHRLTVFEHDVVGDVHDVVDRADTRGAQAHSHPERRGRDFHVLDHARGVAVAEVWRGNADF